MTTHATTTENLNLLKPVEALFAKKVKSIVAVCYQNERPLHGLAGELDWYFHGQISSYIREGYIQGNEGECVYIPIKKQNEIYHVFLVGGGTSDRPGLRSKIPQRTLERLQKNIRSLRLFPVGLSLGDLPSVDAAFKDDVRGKRVCLTQ